MGAPSRAPLAGSAAGVGRAGLCQSQFLGDGNEAVDLRIEAGDAVQQTAGQLLGGELSLVQAASDLGKAQLVHVGFLYHSMTRGTRYRPFSTAGAMAW